MQRSKRVKVAEEQHGRVYACVHEASSCGFREWVMFAAESVLVPAEAGLAVSGLQLRA